MELAVRGHGLEGREVHEEGLQCGPRHERSTQYTTRKVLLQGLGRDLAQAGQDERERGCCEGESPTSGLSWLLTAACPLARHFSREEK